jgi:hypothetical protein
MYILYIILIIILFFGILFYHKDISDIVYWDNLKYIKERVIDLQGISNDASGTMRKFMDQLIMLSDK